MSAAAGMIRRIADVTNRRNALPSKRNRVWVEEQQACVDPMPDSRNEPQT
jgi:hypothetical protein